MPKSYVEKSICKILRFIWFDHPSDRSEIPNTHKFALFLVVWKRLSKSEMASYKPDGFVTFDEQLFPGQDRCSFSQFTLSKPDKYGQKYWLVVDVDSKYVVSGFPYIGKEVFRGTDRRVSDKVVMKLLQPYLPKEEM